MKVISVHDAVGTVLGHDLTQIIPGKVKGRAFKKGHIIEKKDIQKLLEIGKEHLYVMELPEGTLHENEAAIRMANAACGSGITLTEPSEGKVEFKASCRGLLKINVDLLYEINEDEEVMLATLHTNQIVPEGKNVAGTRAIPLTISEKKIEKIEEICKKHGPIVEVKPLNSCKVGVITTGSEVYKGLIKDRFGPVVVNKINYYGSEVIGQIFVPDKKELIVDAIHKFLDKDVDLILVTGGMSVDPDDVTPAGIRAAGGKVVTYGAPVLPGAMFMVSYIGEIPVLGLPGCVMYFRNTVFDLIVPRVLAGETITRRDIVRLAHGGLCQSCKECRFPNCGFGKGY